MAFNCIQIREPNYRDSLLLEPISPEPDMSCRQILDCKSTLMALNENYEKYLNSLPQKQKEYHNLVMAARQSANYPIKQLSAPLMLAKQQTSLIEEQFKQQFLNNPSKNHPLPAFGQIIKTYQTNAQLIKPQIMPDLEPVLERNSCKTTAIYNPIQSQTNYQNYVNPNRIQYNYNPKQNFNPNINPNLQSNQIISRNINLNLQISNSNEILNRSLNPNTVISRNPNVQVPNQSQIISRNVNPQISNVIISRNPNYNPNYNNYRNIPANRNIVHSPHINRNMNPSPTISRISTPTSQTSTLNRNIVGKPTLVQNNFKPNHNIIPNNPNSNRNPTPNLTQSPNIISNFNPNLNQTLNRTYNPRNPNPTQPKPLIMNNPMINNKNNVSKLIVQNFPNFCCNQSCCPTIQLLSQPEKRIPEMMPIAVIQKKPIIKKTVSVKELLEKKKPILEKELFKPKFRTNILKQRLQELPLDLKKRDENSDDDCLVIQHIKRQEPSEPDSDNSSVNLRISLTPETEKQKSEENESEEDFYERLNNLLLQLLRKKQKNIETAIIDTIDVNNEIIDNRFEYEFLIDSQEFARFLNLIKTRDLSRKPIAYLNSRYPLNEVSRSIYAGIATKKSVLDFPTKRKFLEENIGIKKKIKMFERKEVEEFEDKNNWNSVLKSLDFCSPLSQRIIGVLPQFQYK